MRGSAGCPPALELLTPRRFELSQRGAMVSIVARSRGGKAMGGTRGKIFTTQKSLGAIERSGASERIEPATHLSVPDRVAIGRAARADVPRSSHATWEAPRDRIDPIDLLEHQATTRVP